MDLYAAGERALRNAWRLPGLGALLRAAYARHFARLPPNRFLGVFETFDEARAAVPTGLRVGYDHPEMRGMYRLRMDGPCESDWAVLYHLRELLGEARLVLDFGGHVGVSWYGWRRHLGLDRGPRWLVCDVPEFVAEGRALAAERGVSTLSFTDRPEDGRDADLLLAAGSLQYLDEPLPRLIARIGAAPRHVIVNKLPVHPSRGFVTLQSTGRAVHPYRVVARDAFLAGMAGAGYALRDEWRNSETRCEVPFTRGFDVPAYSGFRFDRVAPDGAA